MNILVTVTVKNTGLRGSKFTVLLFLYDIYRRVTPEYKLLKRYAKIHLLPGHSQVVNFTLNISDFMYIGIDHRYVYKK